MTVYWDTEDNSPDLAEQGKSGFEKVCTQIGAVNDRGERFFLKPHVKRTVKIGPFTKKQWDVSPFTTWLCNQDKQVTCYAHNTGYDLGNLWPDDLDMFDSTLVGNRLISARWRNVKFLDSANIWPMALKKVGKAVGLEKMETDVHSRDYMERDVDIVRKAMRLARTISENHGAELSATLGGLCVRIWKAMGGLNWPCSLLPAREAYYGGRTEIFQKEVFGPMKYVDVNSLYPSVMLNPFPTSADLWFDLPSLDDAERYIRTDKPCWGIANVTISIPEDTFVGPLPVRREDESIYYPTGNVSGWWTVHEIRRALKRGSKLTHVSECYGSKLADYYYSDFVKEFYGLREHEQDEGKKLFYKLLMNNLYGQLGMTGKITRSLLLSKHVAEINGQLTLMKEGVPYGEKLLAEMETPLGDHVNWLHAAYVTSYARLRLMDYMEMIPWKSLVYCDTDSIFFEWEGKDLPFPVSTKLGEMKLEDSLTYAHCVAPKLYRVTTEKGKTSTKAKGIPQRTREDGKTLPEVFMDEQHVAFLQPYKLRESIRYVSAVEQERANMEQEPKRLSSWHDVEKRIVSGYTKKTLKKNRYFPQKHVATN